MPLSLNLTTSNNSNLQEKCPTTMSPHSLVHSLTQVTVQFCLHECAPATCGTGSATSFGKRRRRRQRVHFRRHERVDGRSPRSASSARSTSTTTTTRSPPTKKKKKVTLQPTMLPEYPLQREIIVRGIGGGASDTGIFTIRDRRAYTKKKNSFFEPVIQYVDFSNSCEAQLVRVSFKGIY